MFSFFSSNVIFSGERKHIEHAPKAPHIIWIFVHDMFHINICSAYRSCFAQQYWEFLYKYNINLGYASICVLDLGVYVKIRQYFIIYNVNCREWIRICMRLCMIHLDHYQERFLCNTKMSMAWDIGFTIG